MKQICKCCNEEKEHHLQDGSCIGCNVLGKKCKKFEAVVDYVKEGMKGETDEEIAKNIVNNALEMAKVRK